MDVTFLLSDQVLFTIACLTAFAGAIYDLKTTEIPDVVPLAGVLGALAVYLGRGFVLYVWDDIFVAMATSVIFLVIGYVFFSAGQWGEADVLLLASIGFAVPKSLSFFPENMKMVEYILFYPTAFLINCFVVGAVYAIIFTILYAAVKCSDKREMLRASFRGMRTRCIISLIPLAAGCAAYIPLSKLSESAAREMIMMGIKYSVMLFSLFLLLNFAKYADRNVFTRYIRISRLKEGDVLAENVAVDGRELDSKLFVGLTADDVERIKRGWKSGLLKTEKRGYVKVKEGVRYAPTFLLSLLFTAKYGFILFYLL